MFRKVVNVIEVLALVAAAFVVVMLLVAEPEHSPAAAQGGGGGGAAYNPATGALPAGGAEIFAARCAGCHGASGGGGTGPRLAGKVEDDFPDVEDQIVFVTKGRDGMPAFGGSLSSADIRAVVEYTRNGLGR